MKYTFDAEEVSIGPSSCSPRDYISIDVDADADEIFEEIQGDVDHDKLMACLTVDEVREYFDIGEEE